MPILTRLFSTCEIIPNERVIKRYFSDPISLGFFDNEVKWFKQFNHNPGVHRHVPKMIDYSRDTLILEYVGCPITNNTVPINFKNQLRQIASFLKHQNCRHCDITPSNLLVFKTNIFIIDFAFAVATDQNPYRKWRHVEKSMLDHLGGIYRAYNWPNDQYSLSKVYSELTGKTNDKLFS